jgi:hypothetical protein
MRCLAGLLVLVLLAWMPAGPAWAQQQDAPQALYETFDSLLGDRDQRDLYALPPARYWRATGPLQVSLAGGRELGLAPAFVALASDIARATGVEIGVRASALAMMPEAGKAGDLAVLIVARPLGAEFAAGLGIDAEMRSRFADGRWPALFRFRRDDLSKTGRRSGILLVADDLKPAEITAYLALSLVWTMGGASIGDDLGALVDMAGRPGLTERGRRVFALMYDPQLELALPLDEARSRARVILGLPE